MRKIAVEEHYLVDVIERGPRKDLEGLKRLPDLGEGRLKEMNDAGIDMQVLQLGVGGHFGGSYDTPDGPKLASKVNDEVARAIKKYPDRFAAFASLAPIDPRKAADELERSVTELGFKGGQICSNTGTEYFDEQKFWVIFERAEKLGVPIYIHPNRPADDILKPYLKYPILSGSMFGYGTDTSLNAMRMILSGLFDKYPRLNIILGHLGEALPWWLWRLDNRLEKEGSGHPGIRIKKKPSQYIKENFFITTSGMFTYPSLLCSLLTLGADRILFAVDYPHESNKVAVEFMDSVSISDSDREKIYHLNAEKLLRL